MAETGTGITWQSFWHTASTVWGKEHNLWYHDGNGTWGLTPKRSCSPVCEEEGEVYHGGLKIISEIQNWIKWLVNGLSVSND